MFNYGACNYTKHFIINFPKIDDKMFSVITGSIIKHQSCQDHATFTEEETLLALWIWTGKIKGRYWFRGYSEDDCPLEN